MDSFICPADPDLVARASRTNKIGLRPHHDAFDDTARADRVQAFLICVPDDVRPSDPLSRATVFIPGSHRFPDLFAHYWRCHAALLGGKPEAGRFPQYPQFKFDAFCRHYRALLRLAGATEAAAGAEEPTDETAQWLRSVPRDELERLPREFVLSVAHFHNGDLVLFIPGTIHWVMLPEPADDRVMLKAFVELYSRNDWPRDDSGFVLSDGGFKADARAFERRRLDELARDGRQPPPMTARFATQCPPAITPEAAACLAGGGVLVTQVFDRADNGPAQAIADHVGLVAGTGDLTRAATHRDLDVPCRVPGNSRTSIFPKGHGNCAFGAYSAAAHAIQRELEPFLSTVVEAVYGRPGRVFEVSFGVQGPARARPAKPTKRKRKNRE